MDDNLCPQHSGFISDIGNLKKDTDDQWDAINELRRQINGLYVRVNVILAAVLVSLIGIVINLIRE